MRTGLIFSAALYARQLLFYRNFTARFSSPLSVEDFVKKSQFVYYSDAALAEAAPKIAAFARQEGLEGHARSALARCIP